MTIYSIYKSTNKINNKVYIGFTNDFPQRIREHKYASTRRSNKFYTAIKKYGWDNFSWEIIYQSLDKEHCSCVMEPQFIMEFNSFGRKSDGYNLTIGGEAGAGEYNSKDWIVTTPEGIEITVTNLNQFCKLNNLASSGLGEVAKHKRQHYKNWKCRYAYQEKPKTKEIIYKYICTDVDGFEYNVEKLTGFCRQRGLFASGMLHVVKGIVPSYKGWTCRKYGEDVMKFAHDDTPKFKITSPKADVIYVKYLKNFCVENQISYHKMSRISSGKIISSEWKIEKLQ